MRLFKRRRDPPHVAPTQQPGDKWAEMAARLDAMGCTPEEVATIESDQGTSLPPDYRRFLELMGRDGGGLAGGSGLCYPEILGIRLAAIELLVEDESAFRLPEDAVVFMMHQGYQFMYLAGVDPRVHWWTEGSDESSSKVIADSLFDFLLADERSTILSPEQRESHRRSTATMRRLHFAPEVCARCGGTLSWETRLRWGPGEDHQGRARMVGRCGTCNSGFWRWADSPTDRLQEI